MNIVEISGSLGNGLKRYNVFEQVSISHQPFTQRASVLYGVTKPTDIVQTYPPTNILMDSNNKPIGNSKPVYFGIRVYPFISMSQNFSCENNILTYGQVEYLSSEHYFPSLTHFSNYVGLPDPYTGKLYPQPEFVPSLPNNRSYTLNYKQAMQQFINDCTFPTKPNLDLPGQSQSDGYIHNDMPYFANTTCILSELNQREPTGILNNIVDDGGIADDYMIQFDGQNLNFKFGMAVNSDFAPFFAEPPNIYLPYLYRTYAALLPIKYWITRGVIMQCLLYDSNGKVISA